MTVDANGDVYVADAGNRRLLKVNRDGKVEVALRTDPPYFPSGAFATPANDLYVLEVGFTLPGTWSGPRVRKITREGKNSIIALVGAGENSGNLKAAVAQRVGVTVENAAGLLVNAGPRQYFMIALSGVILAMGWAWQRRRRSRRRA